jgi:hypothetical protein
MVAFNSAGPLQILKNASIKRWLHFCHMVWVTCRVHAHVGLGRWGDRDIHNRVETETFRVYNTPPFL